MKRISRSLALVGPTILLALLPLACAKRAEPPQVSAVAPATPDPAPVPDAPAPSAPAPDAAAPVPAPEPKKEFAARHELPDVYFGPGQVRARRADLKLLDAAAAWLKANPDQLVILEGYTDEAGPKNANLVLARRRAKWVLDYLVAKGVEANRITIVPRGEDGAVCSEKTPACQDRNRRVHFLARESGGLEGRQALGSPVSGSPTR